ncbi:MAG: SagB/ThcOx family dehydrogenase [Nitrospira sp.]|jgi:SagB-type dehydrogenase family enzyme|uniref:SagB/ThcOx family dehydrogenase n=1 Tax=Nitrospira sp. ND1 TaxID=1658518 RepID=UPI0009BAD1AF|nr:SagB/ThcOx family dehydrogenase [Nitrospira sp. ND1]MBP6199930.1 SagB/ThcOx family dehydrogenase [Nitrospira sp.]MBP6206963.1 SagB/ThcOx family dehydrogenase [Nitrospira sp.]MBP7362190.1 SagB/ThcOx family dehydrogenase [Nitrospira sp.]MBP8104168.1 SagB/ThcOx family dehydrogenase [Nitrospira sp.]MBP8199780.1 SagB/ThcOx family dehydrogenase [Nitrospira sp.]
MTPEQPSSAISTELLSTDPVDRVIAYHVRTKHHFNRYARSLGYLDWANQPNPFRRFDGTQLVRLPLLKADEEPRSPSYDAIYQPGSVPVQPLTNRTVSRFFELALGLSAWKKAGESEWALRNNPSSGNLHPTEGYVLLPSAEGLDLKPGLYHYAPREHGVELRADCSPAAISRLLAPFPSGAFLFGLTSVHWREAWKYGERAFRYCNHDVGHAIGSARIAAATLGWKMALLDGADQNQTARVLGTHRVDDFSGVEPEHPDCLAVIWPVEAEARASSSSRENQNLPLFLEEAAVTGVAVGPWHGKANELSREHGVHWDVIDQVAEASWKTSLEHPIVSLAGTPIVPPETLHASRTTDDAAAIIRQRRSAVSFDGRTSISAATFFHILQRVMPRVERPQLQRPMPWDVLPWDPAIHLMLFVHRVEGLEAGLYMLARDPNKLPFLQQSMNPELEWTPAPGCPNDLPLFWLLQGDAQRLAAQVSCQQGIAGDSAFSLGMLAEFEGRLRQGGAWWYPRLFWEAGVVGQVLYLEAEAAGVRGTGIGCFFDDPVHEVVGIKDLSIQSLYHFTVGGPVDDQRLMTLPPYHHLQHE